MLLQRLEALPVGSFHYKLLVIYIWQIQIPGTFWIKMRYFRGLL